MFRAADSDNDGYVTTEDFYNIVTKKSYQWLWIHESNHYWVYIIQINTLIQIFYNFNKHMKKQPAPKPPAKGQAANNKALDLGEIKKIFTKLSSNCGLI